MPARKASPRSGIARPPKPRKDAGWSKETVAAAKACSGIVPVRSSRALAGRRAASIARVVKAFYLG